MAFRYGAGLGAIALVVAAVGAVSGCADEIPPSFQWQAVQSDLPGAMLSIWGTTATDVYAVGADANDGTGPQALHFDGTRWTRIDTGTRRGSLWWVHGVSPTQVFMVGTEGTVLRYDPVRGVTERMTTPASTPTLFGVWGASASDVWAVGGNTDGNTGVLWHYDGAAWTAQQAPGGLNDTTIWYKVYGSAANDVSVCGTNGSLLHWNGSAWSRETVPETGRGPLFTVHGRGSQRYAVGGNVSGIVLESDGPSTPWRAVTIETAPRLSGVFVPESGSPLAVGNGGSLYQRRSGSWRQVARPPRTQLDFHAVWVDPTGAIWTVGGDLQTAALARGVIYRFGETIPRSPIVTPESITRCDQTPGNICTYAGAGVAGFNGDGRPLRESMMYWPMDMEFSPDGQPYILDWQNHRVRRVTAAGTFETVMGTDLPGDGPPDGMGDLTEPGVLGTTVALNHPTDLMFQADGRLLVVAWHNHKIRRWDPATGMTYVPLGRGPGWVDGPFATARLKQESKGVLDASGTVMYLLDQGNGRIRRLDLAAQTVSTIAGVGMRGFGGDDGPAMMATFNWQSGENPEPEGGIALDREGRNLYVSDTGNHRIRRIELASGTITTVAGTGALGFGGDNGPALMAQLSSPQDLEFGPDGRLYIADTNNHRIRALDLATGVITTVAGTGRRGYGGDRGPAVAADLYRPHGIAFDAQGNLFICDTLNDRVRRVWR
nr:hypothetical protein [Deltaproteobacteria bacterium]